MCQSQLGRRSGLPRRLMRAPQYGEMSTYEGLGRIVKDSISPVGLQTCRLPKSSFLAGEN